jgi:hypothetical protein
LILEDNFVTLNRRLHEGIFIPPWGARF